MNVAAIFEEAFGKAPSVEIHAPGRINLIGEHIDYLEGWVVPAAIDRHIFLAASEGAGDTIRLSSPFSISEPALVSLSDFSKRNSKNELWLNYVIGVLQGYREAGYEIPAFDAAITSDLPVGAGLSSSAALETGIGLIVEGLTGRHLDVMDRARICLKAEHDFAGVPCGIMDQVAVGAGKIGYALLLDCRSEEFEAIPLSPEFSIVVSDCGVKHALADGEYRKRREDCEKALELMGAKSFRDVSLDQLEEKREVLGDQLFRRGRHAVTEMARVHQFTAAMKEERYDAIGPIMKQGHESLSKDYEVSCPELDHLVASAYEFGVIGSRMTGGGFGGSTICLVKNDAASALCDHLKKSFNARFGRAIEPFVTIASGGAKIVS